MKDKEFLEFLTQSEPAPVALKEAARKDILLSFQGMTLVLKLVAFQVLGAIISLAFCPQFGLSFFSQGHHLTHNLKMIHDCLCALYCGTLFLSSGLILAFIFMKGEELWWIWRRKKYTLLFMPAIFWAILMLLNLTLDLPQEQMIYHITWISAGVLVQVLWFKLRSSLYRVRKLSV